MDRSKALEIIREALPEKRYLHTIGVLETALELSKKYGGDPKKIELAAIFHDYAKYRPDEEMKQIIIRESLPKQLLDFHKELWHAPVGAYLVQNELGIEDEEIYNAIYNHTTGRPNMSIIEKIIFVADYIEPGREFPGVDEARELAKVDIDLAVLFAIANTIIFLTNKRVPIYPDTYLTYNSYVKLKEESSIHE